MAMSGAVHTHPLTPAKAGIQAELREVPIVERSADAAGIPALAGDER